MIHSRSYIPTDTPALIDILRANTPKYFAAEDEADYASYLDTEQWGVNLVYTTSDQIIGTGGAYLTDDRRLNLCWAFFAPGSLGTRFVPIVFNDYIRETTEALGIGDDAKIVLNTTQMIARVLCRYGFQVENAITDGYAPGYDLVTLSRTQLDPSNKCKKQ